MEDIINTVENPDATSLDENTDKVSISTEEDAYEAEKDIEEEQLAPRKRKRRTKEEILREEQNMKILQHTRQIKKNKVKVEYITLNSKINHYLDGSPISGDNGLTFRVISRNDKVVTIDTGHGAKSVSIKYVKFK